MTPHNPPTGPQQELDQLEQLYQSCLPANQLDLPLPEPVRDRLASLVHAELLASALAPRIELPSGLPTPALATTDEPLRSELAHAQLSAGLPESIPLPLPTLQRVRDAVHREIATSHAAQRAQQRRRMLLRPLAGLSAAAAIAMAVPLALQFGPAASTHGPLPTAITADPRPANPDARESLRPLPEEALRRLAAIEALNDAPAALLQAADDALAMLHEELDAIHALSVQANARNQPSVLDWTELDLLELDLLNAFDLPEDAL